MCNIQVQNIFNLFVVDLYNILGMGVNVMWGIKGISFVSSGAISVELYVVNCLNNISMFCLCSMSTVI